MNRLNAMRIFCRVVELQSFSKVATDLAISKASVSKKVSELEAHLNTQLITRSTRKMSITDVGAEYYHRCVEILTQIEDAEEAARSNTLTPRGTLGINAPISFGIMHLSDAITDFMTLSPEVDVDLVMEERGVDLIAGDFDVGLCTRRSLQDSNYIVRALAPVRRVLCASPDYLSKHPAPTSPEQLLDHACLIDSLASDHTRWTFSQDTTSEEVSVELTGRLRVNNSLALERALLRGAGVAVIPAFVVSAALERGDLVPLIPDFTPIEHTLYALHTHTRHTPMHVRMFIDFLAERFSMTSGWDKHMTTDAALACPPRAADV